MFFSAKGSIALYLFKALLQVFITNCTSVKYSKVSKIRWIGFRSSTTGTRQTRFWPAKRRLRKRRSETKLALENSSKKSYERKETIFFELEDTNLNKSCTNFEKVKETPLKSFKSLCHNIYLQELRHFKYFLNIK